jgi:hypothetical protein
MVACSSSSTSLGEVPPFSRLWLLLRLRLRLRLLLRLRLRLRLRSLPPRAAGTGSSRVLSQDGQQKGRLSGQGWPPYMSTPITASMHVSCAAAAATGGGAGLLSAREDEIQQ